MNKKNYIVATLILLSLVAHSYAENLFLRHYEATIKNEPSLAAARADIDINAAKKQQAFGALLPQVNISASANKNKRDYVQDKSIFPSQTQYYDSTSWQVNFTQPIFSYFIYANWKQSSLSLEQATLQNIALEQELISNFITAWLTALTAIEDLSLSKNKKELAQVQLVKAKNGNHAGLISEPELLQAIAEADNASADIDSSNAEMAIKIANIELLSGISINSELQKLSTTSEYFNTNFSLNDEIDNIQNNSPKVKSIEKNLQATLKEIQKQNAGFLPTLDLVANYSNKIQGEGDYPSQSGYKDKAGYIGLQLNIPISSGGAQIGKRKEAIALYEKAKNDLEKTKRTCIQNFKQAFYEYNSAKSREASAVSMIKSAYAALNSANRGLELGQESEITIRKATAQLATAKKDQTKAINEKISAFFKIKSLSGSISESDINTLAANVTTLPE